MQCYVIETSYEYVLEIYSFFLYIRLLIADLNICISFRFNNFAKSTYITLLNYFNPL